MHYVIELRNGIANYLKKTDAVTMHRMTIRMAKTATNRMAIFETAASAGTIKAI